MIFEPKKRRTPIYRELRGTLNADPESRSSGSNEPPNRQREGESEREGAREKESDRRALDLIDELLEQE